MSEHMIRDSTDAFPGIFKAFSVLGCDCIDERDAWIPISSKTLFTFRGSLTMSKRSGTGKSAKGKKKNKGHAAKGPDEVISRVQSIIRSWRSYSRSIDSLDSRSGKALDAKPRKNLF
jgi:hypothetical protein